MNVDIIVLLRRNTLTSTCKASFVFMDKDQIILNFSETEIEKMKAQIRSAILNNNLVSVESIQIKIFSSAELTSS